MLNYFSRQTERIQSLNYPQESGSAQGSKKERSGQGSLVPDGIHIDGVLCKP